MCYLDTKFDNASSYKSQDLAIYVNGNFFFLLITSYIKYLYCFSEYPLYLTSTAVNRPPSESKSLPDYRLFTAQSVGLFFRGASCRNYQLAPVDQGKYCRSLRIAAQL